MRGILPALVFTLFAAAGARAELMLEGVSWQRTRGEKSRVASWEDCALLRDGPSKLDTRLRARLTLKNRGPEEAEGILVRYSMTGRVAPIAGEGTEGVWGIPFMVDEKRVPKIGSNKIVAVYLTLSPALELYLAKLARVGWWPDRLKLEVMIEPHPGASVARPIESVLEVER